MKWNSSEVKNAFKSSRNINVFNKICLSGALKLANIFQFERQYIPKISKI